MCLGLDFTPELATLILQTPIAAEKLVLVQGSCTALMSTQFQEVVGHLSPTELEVHDGCFLPCQVTDEFIRELFENRCRRIVFHGYAGRDRFDVTDDALVDLCMQQDAQIGAEGDGLNPASVLSLQRGSFTKDLVKRLVQVSTRSCVLNSGTGVRPLG